MGRRQQEWLELFRSLGRALGELLAAEGAALRHDALRNGKGVLLAVGLFVAAGFLLFWAAALFAAFLVALFSLWLPVWGAALLVFGLLVLLIGILAGLGWLRLRRVEWPLETIQRRWRDHMTWWDRQVLGEGAGPPHSMGAGDGPSRRE